MLTTVQPLPGPARPTTDELPLISWEPLLRFGLVAAFVSVAHCFRWKGLRFLTSEVILRISSNLGMDTSRVSFDTIRMHGALFCFVISCTFVDVFIGAVPLLWNLRIPVYENILRLLIAGMALFGFNIVRLELGHILYACGTPWVLADDVLGGVAYFLVWIAIWQRRGWAPPSAQCFPMPQL